MKKEEIEAIVKKLNETGFGMEMFWADGFYQDRTGNQALLHVARVDEGLEMAWITLFEVGYDQEWRCVHFIHAVKVMPLGDTGISIVNPKGTQFDFKALDETDILAIADWNIWQQYRRDNKNRFDSIDNEYIQQGIKYAINWKPKE